MKNNDIILEIKKLKKYYGNIRGVEDISLRLNRGEIYGFIGPNGAGKSTTLKCIMNLINKTSGEILVDGKVNDKDNIEIKKMIGYLPSEINLYEDLTVKEMLDFHASFFEKDTSKRRGELIKLLKLEENKKIENLSLGNLKKLGIVLALMHEPKLLILDEATSGLDPIMQKTFYELLINEKKKGTTILYSTHILSEISKICDRIAFIKDGKIIEENTVDNIEQNDITYLTIDSSDIFKIKEDLSLKVIYEHDYTIKFLNNLKPDEIIKRLSNYKINKLLIEEVSIEDLFLEYYK